MPGAVFRRGPRRARSAPGADEGRDRQHDLRDFNSESLVTVWQSANRLEIAVAGMSGSSSRGVRVLASPAWPVSADQHDRVVVERASPKSRTPGYKHTVPAKESSVFDGAIHAHCQLSQACGSPPRRSAPYQSWRRGLSVPAASGSRAAHARPSIRGWNRALHCAHAPDTPRRRRLRSTALSVQVIGTSWRHCLRQARDQRPRQLADNDATARPRRANPSPSRTLADLRVPTAEIMRWA